MNVDLALLLVIAFFALWGAFTGAAKQIANVASMVIAYLCARPLGNLIAPRLAPAFNVPLSVAIVAGTVFLFIAVLIAGRLLISRVLQRLFAGTDPDSRVIDRVLGFVIGAAKVTVLIWFFLCALTFVQENVTIAGRRLNVAPKDSLAFRIAARWNVFELQQLSPVRDLIHVAQAMADPKRAARLKKEPAFQRLQQDPRFKNALSQPKLDEALANGDYRALLRSSAVMNLVQDPMAVEQLRAAAAQVK
ncbi:MAG: CvpA family protein [Myxococcaceae bacterium]|nr:CvpA family protein [Myxococcaceae bacterium]